MQNKTCCFSGHRDISFIESFLLKFRLKKEVTKLINRGVIYFGCGGARGFDLLAAETVIKLKKRYPQIHLILVLPCSDHTLKWSSPDISKYDRISKFADKIKVLAAEYYTGCMHVRNRYLVDNSSFFICYNRKNSGGTVYTLNYAENRGLEIIYL